MANVADFLTDYNQMQADAGKIIDCRVSMMLKGTMSGDEAVEMVAEKVTAMADSMFAGMFAMLSGDPLKVAEAMLRPYRAKTSINVSRLKI